METNKRYSGIEQTTPLWEMYQDGLDYQNKIGLRRDIPVFIKFFEGKQWPDSTENTKNLPRPVVNIIKMICRNKKSSILATPVRIVYKSYDDRVNIQRFNSFAENIMREIGQEQLDKYAIDDAVKKGSYFYHYYWDASAEGTDKDEGGALRCEVVDPLNIFFANPAQTDEQKQKWILISSREDVQKIREISDSDVAKELIEPDLENDENLCTVITRYFRINKEVFCERATKKCVINKPFPIAPDAEAARAELFPAPTVSESGLLKEDKRLRKGSTPEKKRAIATLYPIVCGCYERRERSIYGISEVEGLIPNQKAVNFNIAMSLLNAQETAWGKYITLPNALKGQKISNVPGQVLVDYTGTGDGIKKMTEQSMSTVPIDIVETIINMTRSVCGSSEVMTGETIGSNMSGAAIAQLQSQAQLPIEELRNAFWIVKQKQGRVLSQFLKLFYYEKGFVKIVCEKDGKRSRVYDRFSSSEYENTDFDVTVEAMSGVKASAASDINMLDECLKNGKISPETYIRAYPDSAISNKDEILRQIETEKAGELSVLKAENERIAKELEEAEAKLKKQSDTIDRITSIIEENSRLKEFIAFKFTDSLEKSG